MAFSPPISSVDHQHDHHPSSPSPSPSPSPSSSPSPVPPSHLALHLALSSIFLLRSRSPSPPPLPHPFPSPPLGLPPLFPPAHIKRRPPSKSPSPAAPFSKASADHGASATAFALSEEMSSPWSRRGMDESPLFETAMDEITPHSLRRRARPVILSSLRHEETLREKPSDATSSFQGHSPSSLLRRRPMRSEVTDMEEDIPGGDSDDIIVEFPGDINKRLWTSDIISSQDEFSDESSVSSLSSATKNPPFSGRSRRRYPSFGHDDNETHNELMEVTEMIRKDTIGDEGYHEDTVDDDGYEVKAGGLRLLAKELEEDATAYRMSTDDMSSSPLLWPFGLAIKTIGFQIRLIIQMFSLIGMIFNWCNLFASDRIRETLQAKDRAKEALNQKVSMITRVPPKVAENGSILLKKTAWGCLAATYVCFLLSMLLFPALVLDFVFLSRIVEEPVSIKEPLHFDYTLDNPTAYVSFHPTQRSEVSTGKTVQHKEHVRAIPASHKVHITVILTLPESDYNRNLGMFQLTAELLSESGRSIKSSSRPCMLRFYSDPIRWLKMIVLGLPSLVGIFSESQTLIIHLMEFEGQHVPVTAVKILLQSKAGMPLGQGIPEIYSANVHIESRLPWLKNLLRSWKWTFYIWMGLMLYIMEVIMVLCCCRRALVPKSWVGGAATSNIDMKDNGKTSANANEDSSAGHPVASRQFRNGQRYLNDEIPVARVKQM